MGAELNCPYNYDVSDGSVIEVEVDINDIKDTCNERSRNEECYIERAWISF